MHPGLFTDEAFVQLSDGAQIFFVGLLTQTDDQGVFEWKPITLKMRLRPASKKAVDHLLGELLNHNLIAAYELGGRKFGAVRNFRLWQHPKKPNYIYPIPAEFRTYVGLSPPEFPTSGEPDPVSGRTETPEGVERRVEGEGEEGEREGSARARDNSHKKSNLTKDWLPSREDIAIAQGLGIKDVVGNIERFVSYNLANGHQMVDWSEAWKLWCRRDSDFRKASK